MIVAEDSLLAALARGAQMIALGSAPAAATIGDWARASARVAQLKPSARCAHSNARRPMIAHMNGSICLLITIVSRQFLARPPAAAAGRKPGLSRAKSA